MTADKHVKRAARELAAREGIAYAAARRRLGEVEGLQEVEPPRILSTSQPCPAGCEGSGHPGTVCWSWRPEEARNMARWAVLRSAELPGGRAEQVAQRADDAEAKTSGSVRWANFHGREARWLLALVYAMLTAEQPELRPDPALLRAAVEADDLGAVDAAMEPLDRAAARLLTKDAERWWREVKPRLDVYAAAVPADNSYPSTWQEVDARAVVWRLVERWRKAWEATERNMHGVLESPGVMWPAPKGHLDALLVARHGGHAPRSRVRLADGRPALVVAAEWAQAGPPVAYLVQDLVPGNHGNVGRLVPRRDGGRERVPAADCLSYVPDPADLTR
ncbi:hypothetical protein ABT234_12110 [Streptomyces sp. NPDC001586]|uniref:hypothetical protein n=1 Tax=Streptomyces sp. NPDC001586 TaxID=3154387 RepID=UPI0033175DEA